MLLTGSIVLEYQFFINVKFAKRYAYQTWEKNVNVLQIIPLRVLTKGYS